MTKITQEQLKTKLIDEMSDGQWHPFYKIKKELKVKTPKTEQLLSEELHSLVKQGLFIKGNNESYRVESKYLTKIHSSDNYTITKESKPRYHGGILEDDGWLLAPLKPYDMVHFRMDKLTSSTYLRKLLGESDYHINIDNNTHLVRIFAPSGSDLREHVNTVKAENPDLGINSIRLESNLRRRMLSDLPPLFVAELCAYYGQFAKILLRSHMSSVRKHIKEVDDIQQQIYLWVIEAIQRYDAETSIPFAAYLSSSLNKWVFNLARESYGRAIADAEIRHARIINSFIAEHGREPNVNELSKILGNTAAGVNKDRFAMASVSNILNTTTIHHEDGDLQIEAENEDLISLESLTNITMLSASILHGVKNSKYPIAALVYIYYKSWGKGMKGKKLNNFMKDKTVKRVGESAIKRSAKILKKDDVF